jgi:hypothetical protein
METPKLKQHELADVVMAIDTDGNPFRRKILTGIRRNEFILTRHPKGMGMVRFRDLPEFVWVTNMETGKNVKRKLPTEDDGTPVRLFFMLTENAMQDALTAGFTVTPFDEIGNLETTNSNL